MGSPSPTQPHKTGVYVHVAEYGVYLLADLYWLGGYMVLRCSAESYTPILSTPPTIEVTRVRHWWDRAKLPSTLITLAHVASPNLTEPDLDPNH